MEVCCAHNDGDDTDSCVATCMYATIPVTYNVSAASGGDECDDGNANNTNASLRSVYQVCVPTVYY